MLLSTVAVELRDSYDERAEDLIDGSAPTVDPWAAARSGTQRSGFDAATVQARAGMTAGAAKVDALRPDGVDPDGVDVDDFMLNDDPPEFASLQRELAPFRARIGLLIGAGVCALVLLAFITSRFGSDDEIATSEIAGDIDDVAAAPVVGPTPTVASRDWSEGSAGQRTGPMLPSASIPSASMPSPNTVIPNFAAPSLEVPIVTVPSSSSMTTGAIDIGALQRSVAQAEAEQAERSSSLEDQIAARAEILAAEIARASAEQPAVPDVSQPQPTGAADYRIPVTSTAGLWKPQPGVSWQIDFSPHPNLDRNVDVYVLDLDRVTTNMVSELHGRGRRVICYFSAGTIEDFRSDYSTFPRSVIGNTVAAWPSERWIDVAQADRVGPLMQARMDRAQGYGCDGVDFDNVDGFMHPTGFDITRSEQLRYNEWLAAQAHARGMSAGLKNDLLQVPELVDDYEWLISESCINYNECWRTTPFIEAGKPVLGIDYSGDRFAMCTAARTFGIDFIAKSRILGPEHSAC